MHRDQEPGASHLGFVTPAHLLDVPGGADVAALRVGFPGVLQGLVERQVQGGVAAGAPLGLVGLPRERLVLVVLGPREEDRVGYSLGGAVVELGGESGVSAELRTVKGILELPSCSSYAAPKRR